MRLRKWHSGIERCLAAECVGRTPMMLWTAYLGMDVNPLYQLDKEALRHEGWRVRKRMQVRLKRQIPASCADDNEVTKQMAGQWKEICRKWK
eukprot:6410791-Karenia_brevis.AAC.1